MRYRWAVLAAAGVLVAVGVFWGAGVFGLLTGGGFEDPASESTLARERVITEVGNRDVDVLVLYSSAGATVADPALRATWKRESALPGSLASRTSPNRVWTLSRICDRSWLKIGLPQAS